VDLGELLVDRGGAVPRANGGVCRSLGAYYLARPRAVRGSLPLGAESRPWKGLIMKYQKERVSLVDLFTGEELVSADLTAPRVKAIVKAYALAGITLGQKERVSA
jgi:hypothetical protein